MIEYFRENNIPVTEVDRLLFKIQSSKDNFQIYKVLFHQLAQGDSKDKIRMPDGSFHIGWPNREETSNKLVRNYRREVEPLVTKTV